ncbi:MAG: proton-conducting transporter membrane subunit [Anaerolineales bacterium]|jgi:formate hydrogenlyase subunit 3/multisubunit Na+/H+ antiporter MnhD subunit
MSGPFILFVISGISILIAMLLRNDTRAASILAAGGSFVCVMFIFLVPTDQVIEVFNSGFKLEPAWDLLGRALVLDQATQPMVGFLYIGGGFLLLPAWLVRSSKYFPALALAIVTVSAAALMASPFLYAAIFIEFAAIGGGLLLVSRDSPRNMGALRLLILYTLAMLIILITGWVLDQGSITSAATELVNRTTLVMVFGIAVLILIPPFHIWLINASQESNPYALSFVVLTLQSSALFFLYRFLDVYPWLRESEVTFQALRVGGLLCLAVGVPFAASQRDLRKTLAYMIVADIGFTLLAIGAFSTVGYRLALGMTASRIVSLGVLSLGLSVLVAGNNTMGLVLEPEKSDLLPRVVVIVGMLSLSGFPLTAGFPGRWSLLTILLGADSLNAALVFTAYLSLCIMTVWWGYRLLRAGYKLEWRSFGAENIFMGLGVLIILLLGIFPQLTFPWVVELVSGLTRLFG